MMTQDVFALVSIFCDVDDFCKQFEPEWHKIMVEDRNSDKKKRNRKTELSLSEAITIVIMFYKTRYRTFKLDFVHVCSECLEIFALEGVYLNRKGFFTPFLFK